MEGQLVSTRDLAQTPISYTDALLEGLAPDGGLYVPTHYPQLTSGGLQFMNGVPYTQIALEVKKRLVGGKISEADLENLIHKAYTHEKFDFADGNVVPIREIAPDLFIQNLSLGPTAAFKDMALQQLGQEVNYELGRRNSSLVILGATSGDTGSSAEAAFKGLDRVKLFMLSPEYGMSDFQKAQMGSLTGGNIFNISVRGRFDDCQDLVKELKRDPEFAKLGAVNSINWGRISSQVPYFVSGYLQTAKSIGSKVDFVVPTGNFGNILSGYIAKQMGVPIRKLIVATNENDVIAKLIKTGIYELTPAQITSSPSMDISKASNYERFVFDLLGRDPEKLKDYMNEFARTGRVDLMSFGLKRDVFSKESFLQGTSTHQDRLDTIRRVYNDSQCVIDPHTADAVTVAYRHKVDDGIPMVAMETALAVKFEPTISEALGFIPSRDSRFLGLEEKVGPEAFYTIDANPDKLKNYIRSNI